LQKEGVEAMTEKGWTVRMGGLAGVTVAILLICAISSADTGASDHYNKCGKELSNEGKHTEADKCFDTAIWLNRNDWADAPVVTAIDVSCQEVTVNNSIFYLQEMSEGAMLSFGLSNYDTADMFVNSVYIDVLNYSPNRISNETRHYLSLVPEREYSCTILPSQGTYECQMAEGSNELLKLSPREQERLNITLRAEKEGVYLVRVGFKYAIGDRSMWYSDRQNQTIEFYDSSKRSDGWRGV
jgi:hypothetical protein